MKITAILSALVFLVAANLSRADTETEVGEWYKSYAAHWLDANVDVDKVVDYYASPFYYLASTGPILDDHKSMKASLTAYAEKWKKDGWSGAELLSMNVEPLNSSSAMIHTEWNIFREDGSSVIGCERAPWTYLVSKVESGWQLTLEIENDCPS